MGNTYFEYLHLRFDIKKGRKLAANYEKQLLVPDKGWLPHWYLITDEETSEVDLSRFVLFATIVLDRNPVSVLIDGFATVVLAERLRTNIQAVTLNVKDSINILTTPMNVKRDIKNQAKELGLL